MVEVIPTGAFPEEQFDGSVQEFPKKSEVFGNAHGAPFYLTFALQSGVDDIIPWGRDYIVRDRQLRDFWPTEPFLAGAFSSICMRDAAFEWEIVSKNDRLVTRLTEMLNNAGAGAARGWIPFMLHYSQNRYGQDNGAFIEMVRDESTVAGSPFKGPRAPVVGINSLDSARCVRTGNPEWPVIYYDIEENPHKMRWYEVIAVSEFPAPKESMNGIGVCAVSRVLRMAQILRSTEIFKDEKITGRRHRAIHFVSGVSRTEIADQIDRTDEEADNRGQIAYIDPVILASLDPEKPVTTASIDLAALPDGFDMDDEMRWYVTALALGFGTDYQELAPLPSSAIGSGEQSQMLHKKSRGKGPALAMQSLENIFKYHGVLPRNAELRFTEKDLAEELQQQEANTKLAEELAINVRSGVLNPQAAREILKTQGVYDSEILALIPDEWGEQLYRGKEDESSQNLGVVKEDTLTEDVRRNKGLVSRIFKRG